jgi:antitoxin (DNA-binding transcriptional repressor) of toxin-antitoxin stability system
MPDTYSLDEAPRRFADIMARVRNGETVALSDGGVTVAEIHPVAPRRQTLEERLAELEARGELTRAPAGSRADFFPAIATVPGALERFLQDRNR